jgi:hypothetical protein
MCDILSRYSICWGRGDVVAGTYSYATTAARCLPCPARKSCAGSLALPVECTVGNLCPEGTTHPTPCPLGYFCPSGAIAATACPAGTHGAATQLTSADCTGTCLAGFYCPPTSTNATAVVCPAGHYCFAGTGAPSLLCPPGHFCVPGSASPSPCPQGMVQSTRGAAQCRVCPLNMLPVGIDSVNATACRVCPADGMNACFMANAFPVAASKLPQRVDQRSSIDPFQRRAADQSALLSGLTAALAALMGVVLLLGSTYGVWLEQRSLNGEDARDWWGKFDLLFDKHHHVSTSLQPVPMTAFQSRLGGVMSVLVTIESGGMNVCACTSICTSE